MSVGWTMVPLGVVLRQRKEFVTIDSLMTYKRPRVQLHAKGIVLRDEIPGTLIKTKQQQICHADEFLVAEIDAKVGGYGIVPEFLDGAIASGHYFLFTINKDELEPRFLDYFTRTPSFHNQVNAQGSTNYAAIRPVDVLAYEIPLPPIHEQRRLIALAEQLTSKIKEAIRVRQQAVLEATGLIDSTINQITAQGTNNSSWEVGTIPMFAEVNPSRKGQIHLDLGDMVSFVPMKAVDDVTGTIAWSETRPFAEVGKGYTWFKEGDVIFARITPCMQNGKAAIAQNLVNGTAFGSTEFHVIRPGPKVKAEWLHTLVRHKAFRDDAADHFKGTAGQQRVPQSFLEQKLIPIPPLTEQQRILAYLQSLGNKVKELEHLQKETSAELDALIPSILDRAFKGEL